VENAAAAAAAADVASFQAAVDPIIIPQRHIYILTWPTSSLLRLEAQQPVGDDQLSSQLHYCIKRCSQRDFTAININT